MTTSPSEPPSLKRVLVATDRSESADRAVRWAAQLAAGADAELLLLRVLLPPRNEGAAAAVDAASLNAAQEDLERLARDVAGSRGRARVVVDEDPARAILEAVALESVDTVVVGNVGMAGRKEFLLGNIPNQISHNARCNVIIINTAGPAGESTAWSARPRQPGGDGAMPEGRLLGRAMRIGRVLVKAGVRELRGQRSAEDGDAMRERARRLRSALDELGPTFAKLGQILSTRPDLLPPAVIEELATLQERVTPLTEAEVVGAMERELGVPWEDVFASIDPVPLAAGTIAQVHRATLENGERVVVKVQRPTAEADILQDLGLLEMFASRAANRPAFRRVFDLPAMIQYLSDSLRRELDFRVEASNMKRMREVLAPFSRLEVPKVYEQYSTARLLVMEEVQGGPLASAPEGEARGEAARQLLESFYEQVMTAGFFHADPHPGNMKWWNDTIYLLDLGMVGELEPAMRDLMLLLMLAFAQEDGAFLSEISLMLAGGDQDTSRLDLDSFRAALQALITKYRSLSLREMQLGPILQEVTEIAVGHGIRLPASLTLTAKAFAQMQLAASELDPTLDPFSVARSFVMRRTLRKLTGGLNPQSVFYEGQKLRFRLTRAIEAVEGAIGARPGSPLQVNFRGTERLEEAVGRAGRQLALALGLTGAVVGTAATANSQRVPRWVPALMGLTSGGLGLRLLVELRGGKR